MWVKIGEPISSFKYDGTTWQKYNKVLIGTLVIESGQLTDFENVDLYENNFNLTTFNSSTISHYAMPGDRYIDLTLGATGTLYKAPATGYFYLSKNAPEANQHITLELQKAHKMSTTIKGPGTIRTFIPIKKDDIVKAYYNATGATEFFRFIYAEGEG